MLVCSIKLVKSISFLTFIINKMTVFKELNKQEIELFKKLDTPLKIQEFLDTIKYRAEDDFCSPRQALKEKRAHCFDGSLIAYALLRYHGFRPSIIELFPYARDDSHMLAVYKKNGYWGSVAKSNFPFLTIREPVYKSLREMVMTYFEFFFNKFKEKTLFSYTKPIDLKKFDSLNWLTDSSHLETVAMAFRTAHRFNVITSQQITSLSPVTKKSFEVGMYGVDTTGLYNKF